MESPWKARCIRWDGRDCEGRVGVGIEKSGGKEGRGKGNGHHFS